jgi:hypothetical protein
MRRLAIGLNAVAILSLIVAAWYGLHSIPADFIYGVEAEFDGVPENDAALEQWTQSQPRVWRAFVEREQVGARTRITVTVGMTQNGWGEPPFPDLTTKCAELGYRGQQGPFRDQSR